MTLFTWCLSAPYFSDQQDSGRLITVVSRRYVTSQVSDSLGNVLTNIVWLLINLIVVIIGRIDKHFMGQIESGLSISCTWNSHIPVKVVTSV